MSSSSLIFLFMIVMRFYILVTLLFLAATLAMTAADDVPEEEVMELLEGIANMEPGELMEMQAGLQEVVQLNPF